MRIHDAVNAFFKCEWQRDLNPYLVNPPDGKAVPTPVAVSIDQMATQIPMI